MSWLYSQALVAEFSEANSWDGEQFVQSNGKPIPQAYLSPDKMTDFSRLSRFGMTYKPLTEHLGGALLTWYLEDFRAKTSAQQVKEPESTESVQECGEKWRGSFVKYDPDTLSWRTHQCSLLGDLEPFLETWPQWGLMRDGECWEQQTLEQTIRGTESGLSRETWPTPDANCGQRGTQPNWTPKRKSGQPAQYTINQAVRDKMFPKPTAHNAKECNSPSEKNRNTPTLATHAGGKLNPTWVEWLMGWPLGWTDLKPLVTDKCHSVQQQPGEF
jgi:hypothetical protein